MSGSNTDFFVIYNRALSPMAETNDTELALRFTEVLVNVLELECGYKGHYGDRDARLGCNVFDELRRNIRETRKTVLVVTHGFLSNCWTTYCSQSAFKTLLDTKKSHKLIPVGINISESMQLETLNITEWIHFSSDWQDTTSQKWNVIRQALTYDGPLSNEPTYQEHFHVQDYGDDKLRSAQQTLVVQPASLQSGEFLNEKFLMNLAKNFVGDWKTLAINLELNDHTVTEHEINNRGNVHLQAYTALKCWQLSQAGTEETKVAFLLSVLMEMGNKMVAETVEADYKHYMQKTGQSPSIAAGVGEDEADMGISRRSNTGRVLDQHQLQTDGQQPARSSLDDHSTGSRLLHTTNVTRELRPVTACIEAELMEDPDALPISSNSVQLQQGPSMSLPPAPILKLPNLRVSPEREMYQLTSNDSIDGKDSDASDDDEQVTGGNAGPDGTENLPVVNEHIISSAAQNQLTERNVHDNVLDAQTGSHHASDDVRSTRTSPHGEILYQNQHSLSKDDDLTADVIGTDSRQSVIDSRQPVTDCRQSVTDSRQSVTDPKQSVADSRQPITDSRQSVADSRQSVTASRQPVTDSRQPITDSGQSVTDSRHSVTDSRHSVTDSRQPVTDSRQPVTDSRQPVTDSRQPITDSRQLITDSRQPVIDSSKSATNFRESVTSHSEKPRNLDIHQGEPGVPALNLDSRNAADVTPDSGYSCSDADTPVNDKIIPHESQLHRSERTPVMSGNTEDESKTKGMNNVCQGEAEGETDLSSTSQTQNEDNRTQNGNQIDENITQNGANMKQIGENQTYNGGNGNQLGENRIQNGEKNSQNGENRNQIGESRIQNVENSIQNGANRDQFGINKIQNEANRDQFGTNKIQNEANRDQFGINKIQNEANRSQNGHESSVASNSNMNNSNAHHVSVDDHQMGAGSGRQSGDTGVTKGASDTAVPAQRGEERSLVSLVVGTVYSFWSRLEFAYS